MDESYCFNWNNTVQEEVIIENSESDFSNKPEEFQELNIVPQNCEEVEVVSSLHDQNLFIEGPPENVSGEVVEQWEGSCAEVIVGDDQEPIQDVEVPLPMDQDEYILSTPYPCDFCNKRFRKKIKYLKHMAAHENMQKSMKYYSCSTCRIRFSIQNDLINHQKNHDIEQSKVETKASNVDKGSFACGLCGVAFSMKKALTAHMSIHEGDSPLACKQCNQTFWDMSSLEEHWQVIHASMNTNKADSNKKKRDDTYGCTICGLSFCHQNDLKRHQRNHDQEDVENSEYEYTCNICGESYNNTYDLELHTEQSHGDAIEYQCMFCGDSFLDEVSQLKHIREQHYASEVLRCQEASTPRRRRARANDRDLLGGIRNGKIGDQLYSCKVCGKNFNTRSSQQIHLRVHTGERPYACSFCHKAFTDGGTLRKHERIHTGEKPYACVLCSKAFNQRVVLREHIRTHHSGADPLQAGSMTPYTCGVCSDMFSASQDLILHLIHHCDINTAMKRPPRTGPRKYVRRRKLHEYDTPEEQSEEEEEEEGTHPVKQEGAPKYEIDMDVRWTNTRHMPSKKGNDILNLKSNQTEQEIENISEDHISLLNVPRTKMLLTGKKQRLNAIRDYQSYKEKQRQGFSGNSKSHTKKDDERLDSVSEDFSAVDNLLKLVDSENSEISKSFPIEMQVEDAKDFGPSEIISTGSNKSFEAPEPLENTSATSLSDAECDTEENGVAIKGEYEEEVVYEDPDNYVISEETIVTEENTEATASYQFPPEAFERVESQNISTHQEIMDPLLEFAEISMQHAKSLFKCEICSAVFIEKSQLLAHVQVHI